MAKQQKQISFGITGASGAPYALRLLKSLSHIYDDIHLMISDAARIVLATEVDLKLPEQPTKAANKLNDYCGVTQPVIKVYSKENWYSPVASGSAAPKQMIICPASMGAISAIASGASNTLLERAADVVLKEKGQLIVVPREMPFSSIHLRNLLTLSEMGVTIMPAAPGFYHNPTSIDELIDFVCGRVLDHLGVENQLTNQWGYKT